MGKDDPPPYTPYGGPAPGPIPAGFVPPQPGYPQQPGFQQPQPGYPQQPPAGTTNVIVTHTVAAMPLGPEPVSMMCPSCHHIIKTSVETKATSKTHLFAILLCLFLCWPCFCLPYCMDSCQGHSHTCPNCGAFIGMYEG